MRVVLEASAFLALAALVHLAAWAPRGETGTAGSGAGGESLLSVKASSASIEQMVEAWEEPPETVVEMEPVMEPPALQEPPDILDMPEIKTETRPATAQLELPEMPARPDAPPMPVINTPPDPEPELEPEPEPEPKPEAKPEPEKKPSHFSASVAAQRAKGTGGGVAQGQNQKSQTATVSKSKRASLLSKWGSQIRAKIVRSTPRGSGSGTAIVKITVSGSGVLQAVSLAKSSGNARVDKTALKAVRNAGRFPAAPKSLGVKSQTFRVPIKVR